MDIYKAMRHVFPFLCTPTPEDLKHAETVWPHFKDNQQEILRSHSCYCPFCASTCEPKHVHDWDDNNSALCPECGMPTLLGDASGIDPKVMFPTGTTPFVFALDLKKFSEVELMDYLNLIRTSQSFNEPLVRRNTFLVAFYLSVGFQNPFASTLVADFFGVGLTDPGAKKFPDVRRGFDFLKKMYQGTEPVANIRMSEYALGFRLEEECAKHAYEYVSKTSATGEFKSALLTAWHLADGYGVEKDKEFARKIVESRHKDHFDSMIQHLDPYSASCAFLSAFLMAYALDELPEKVSAKKIQQMDRVPYADQIHAYYLIAIAAYEKLVEPETAIYARAYQIAKRRKKIYATFSELAPEGEYPYDEYCLDATFHTGAAFPSVFRIFNIEHDADAYELNFTMTAEDVYYLVSPTGGFAERIEPGEEVEFSIPFVHSYEGSECEFTAFRMEGNTISFLDESEEYPEEDEVVFSIRLLTREDVNEMSRAGKPSKPKEKAN